jgi:Uma2 family endonuclease
MDTVRQHLDHAGEVKSMSDMLTETPTPTKAARAQAATAAIPVHDLDGEPEFHIRPITVAEYNAMGEAGILDPDERVELVDGLLIVPPPPQGAPHVSIILRLYHHFNARFGKRVLITSQMPVIVSERSEPEPDFALVGWRDDFYASAIPTNADAVAIVEVSDTTLRMDRGRKRTVYARAGIPEYWIVNVRAKQIEIHRDPQGDAYAETHIAKPGDSVAFAAFPDVVFTVDELLG